MKNQSTVEVVPLPVSQHPLAAILLEEVGNLTKHRFTYEHDEWCLLSGAFPDAISHVRTSIRGAVLAERGQRIKARQLYEIGEGTLFWRDKTIIGADSRNNIVYKGKLDECPDALVINELLAEPLHRSYTWHQVTYWKLGDFNKLLKSTISKYLLLKKSGVLLFSDELVQLQEGKIITPYHWGGVFGWLVEELDTFAVRNQELYRVQADLSD